MNTRQACVPLTRSARWDWHLDATGRGKPLSSAQSPPRPSAPHENAAHVHGVCPALENPESGVPECGTWMRTTVVENLPFSCSDVFYKTAGNVDPKNFTFPMNSSSLFLNNELCLLSYPVFCCCCCCFTLWSNLRFLQARCLQTP